MSGKCPSLSTKYERSHSMLGFQERRVCFSTWTYSVCSSKILWVEFLSLLKHVPIALWVGYSMFDCVLFHPISSYATRSSTLLGTPFSPVICIQLGNVCSLSRTVCIRNIHDSWTNADTVTYQFLYVPTGPPRTSPPSSSYFMSYLSTQLTLRISMLCLILNPSCPLLFRYEIWTYSDCSLLVRLDFL